MSKKEIKNLIRARIVRELQVIDGICKSHGLAFPKQTILLRDPGDPAIFLIVTNEDTDEEMQKAMTDAIANGE